MNTEVEETVIVTVSLLGMAEVGTGTATFRINLASGDLSGEAAEMQNAFTSALGEAMMDVYPHFRNYTRTKYGPNVDNPPDQ